MLLRFSDGTAFTSGACHYISRPAALGNRYVRPFLTVRVGDYAFDAAVDTGGFFLILTPDAASSIQLNPAYGDPFVGLFLRGETYSGSLHRVELIIPAEHGETLTIEVTAFVPDREFDGPPFLGWPLCLERFRFAFQPSVGDPYDEWFHFGPLD